MYKHSRHLIFLSILLLPALLHAQITYPNLVVILHPSDNPAPPGGGVFVPPVNNSAPPAKAAEFAEIMRIGDPGNVLPFTEYQTSKYTANDFAKDCRYTFFGQTNSGDLTIADAQILRLDSINGSIIIPKNMPQDAMYLVWPGNNYGHGNPLAINQTDLDWVGPNQASVGDTVSAYGRNLGRYGTNHIGTNQSWVYLKPISGSGTWATVVNVNPYKVDFVVPALANGKYEVWVHNGRGGNYGWSGPDTLTLVSPTVWTSTVFNVKSYGATGNGSTDDRPAIQLALNAASSNPYSTIYFPTGTYIIDTNLTLPGRVRILGDGMNLSRIRIGVNWGGPYSNYMIFEGGGSYFSHVQFQNIAIDASDTGTVNGVETFYARSDSEWHFNNVLLKGIQAGSNYGTSLNDFTGSVLFFLKNCILIGGQTFMGGTQQIFFDSCHFYQTNDVLACLQPWVTNGLSANNCIAQDYNDADTNGWGDGRFVTGNTAWGSIRNTYFGNITTINFAPRNVAWLDQNTGEQFNFEGPNTYYAAHPLSATLSTITFSNNRMDTVNSGYPEYTHLLGNTLVIIGGKGLGQWRIVTGTSGPTVTVNKPFNLAPDSSSMITFGPYYEKTVLYNNHISGKIGSAQSTGGRAGIEPYGCSLNLIADHNSIQHVGGALSVWAMPGASQETATYFNLFSNNKIKDCNVGSAIYFTDWGG